MDPERSRAFPHSYPPFGVQTAVHVVDLTSFHLYLGRARQDIQARLVIGPELLLAGAAVGCLGLLATSQGGCEI